MKKSAVIFLLILLFSCLAFAQSQVKLKQIVVTPSRTNSKWLSYPDSATSLRATKSVDVITQDQIKMSGARNVPALLRDQVGIEVHEYLGNGKAAIVDIRGFGETAASNVLVLVNGRRTNANDMSGADLIQIDIDAIEKVEILRGSQTVLYGDNAVGGVINIITKRGTGKKPKFKFNYEMGSYRYALYGGQLSGGSQIIDYFFDITTTRSNGYRGNSDIETIDFTNTLDLKPTKYLNFRSDMGYHKDWYGLSGALTDVQIDGDGMRATDNPYNCAKTEDFYWTSGFDFRNTGQLGNLTFTTDFLTRNRRTATVSHGGWGGAFELDNHLKTLGITPKAVFESEPFGIPNRLVCGIDYYKYKDEIMSGNYRMPKNIIVIDEQVFGLYANESIDVTPEFTINGGCRFQWVGYKFDQQAVIREESRKSPFEYAFDAGLNYKYNERSAVYGTISRLFRFPAVDEWYTSRWAGFFGAGGGLNLDLEPQTGMDYEFGIRDNTVDWLKLNADYFIMDIKHELFFDPWAAMSNSIYDHTVRHGLEAEAHINCIENLDIYGRYTYEKAFFVGSHYAGNEIPMVPRHKFTWGVKYSFMDCFDVSYVANFVGDRRFISDQQNLMRTMKYYYVNDVVVAYHKYGLWISLAANNIFDYQYSGIGAYGQYYPANGRNFTFTASYKF